MAKKALDGRDTPVVSDGAGAAAPALRLRSLSVGYEKQMLCTDVNLSLPAGSSAAIIGPSGSGKSSILACILGLLKPKSGDITVAGKSVRKLRGKAMLEYRRKVVAPIFQHGELIGELEPAENVAVAAVLAGFNRLDAWEKARRMLESLGVPEAGVLTRELSGGERQRVAVARALINRPALVLADEPTASLDPELQQSVADLVLGIPEQYGTSLLLVTHDHAFAKRADKQYVLDQGQLSEVDQVTS